MFLGRVNSIKRKRIQETIAKQQTARDQKQALMLKTYQSNLNLDSIQSIPVQNSTLMESKLNQTKLEMKIQTIIDRKVKIDEDNFKRKIFLLNKREYIKDVKDIQIKKAKETQK